MISPASPLRDPREKSRAFTLIELLTVVAIIGVLMGLLFPVASTMFENGKKAQAKNDMQQTVNAIKAFYLEYSRYPVPDGSDGVVDSPSEVKALMEVLMGKDGTLNPQFRKFIDPKQVKEARGGLQVDSSGGILGFFDPWEQSYQFFIDADYNEEINLGGFEGPAGPGSSTMATSVAGASVGKDRVSGTKDDVVSWK